MSKPEEKKSISALIGALIASLLAAIQTHRTNTGDVAKQKEKVENQITELEERLGDADDGESGGEDADELREKLDEVFTAAWAAKPPTDEQIEEVQKIEAGEEPEPTGAESGGTSSQPK